MCVNISINLSKFTYMLLSSFGNANRKFALARENQMYEK